MTDGFLPIISRWKQISDSMNDKGGTKMEKTKLTHLLEQMTIDEKIDQLLQLAAAFYSDKAEEKPDR